MRNILSHYSTASLKSILLLVLLVSAATASLMAQDSSVKAEPVTKSYVKNTFSGNYLIDDQTVMVPVKKTFGFYISHHFGTVNQGISNFFGVFELANMQFSFTYVPVKNLQLGFGFGNYNMEVNGKCQVCPAETNQRWFYSGICDVFRTGSHEYAKGKQRELYRYNRGPVQLF